MCIFNIYIYIYTYIYIYIHIYVYIYIHILQVCFYCIGGLPGEDLIFWGLSHVMQIQYDLCCPDQGAQKVVTKHLRAHRAHGAHGTHGPIGPKPAAKPCNNNPM